MKPVQAHTAPCVSRPTLDGVAPKFVGLSRNMEKKKAFLQNLQNECYMNHTICIL